MAYRAIIFDYGGVMTREYRGELWAEIFAQQFGVSINKIKSVASEPLNKLKRGQITDLESIGEFNQLLGTNATTTPEELWPLVNGFLVHREMQEFVRELQIKGFKTALLSNVFPVSAQLLEAAGCYDNFDVKVLSCEVGFAKPDQEIYQLTLDLLGVAAEECIFVDDQQKCLSPADELGIKTILAVNQNQIIKDMKQILGLS